MIADKKDIQGTLQVRHTEAIRRVLPEARLLAGAAPVMDGLTRSPEWERFCTILQGMAVRFGDRKQAALLKLSDPSIVDDQQVRKLRQDVFEAGVWLTAMQFAIELPAAIVKGGEEATKFIAQFEKPKDETATNT